MFFFSVSEYTNERMGVALRQAGVNCITTKAGAQKGVARAAWRPWLYDGLAYRGLAAGLVDDGQEGQAF